MKNGSAACKRKIQYPLARMELEQKEYKNANTESYFHTDVALYYVSDSIESLAIWRMKLYFRYEIVFISFACGYGKKEEGSRNDTMNKGNLSQGNAQHKKKGG